MITPLPDWSWDVEGGGVTLRLSRAPALATIRYRERVRPLRPALAVARAHAADLRGATVGPVRPVLTLEGEHAALVSVDGTANARSAQRTIGLVFADDFHTEVDGLALGRELFDSVAEAVETLVREDRLLLGVRRRRFVYQPPPGWYGYAPLDLHAHWFPPSYPRDARMLVVYPALPRNAGAAADAQLEIEVLRTGPTTGLIVEAPLAGPMPVHGRRLSGHAWEIGCHDAEGRRWLRRVIVLTGAGYAYPFFYDRARDQDDGNLDVIDRVVRSVEPLPSGEAAPAMRGAAILAHWS